ncbi:TonB-dependent receptor plug domain-containing protein [Desulfogranum japonicum]|uniref:TonB-dependent receptor plug domain-containing protein n=1 Tax=Desulfogranum japonicum TaxID=231447 RepID=UPI001969E462|nr:TonB-dependent receptor [Desulfogranum japonicum]
MKTQRTLPSVIALAGLLYPMQAQALEDVDLSPIVVTSTMVEQQLSQAPGTVQVIESKEIATLGAESVADVLLQAAGISISSGSGRSREISIRGLGSGHTLLLLDGRRLTGGYNATVDANQIPLVVIDRIEIVRGPGSAIYGSEATGGVVNIITRSPSEKTEAALDVRGATGQAAQQSIQAMAGSSVGPLRATAAVSHSVQDGYDTDIYSGQEIDDTKLSSVYTRAALDLLEGHLVSFGGEWNHFEREGLRYYMKKLRERQGDDERLGGYLQYESDQSGPLNIMARLYGNHSEGSYDFSPPADEHDNERDLGQAELRASYRTGEKFTFTAGGEARRESLEGDQMNIGHEDGESEKSQAIFGQIDWSPFERFNLVSSLRYDDYDSAGSHFTPRIMATLFFSNAKVWTSYGQGFRAATLNELYGKESKNQGKDLYIGNNDLDPETSESYEAGIALHKERIHCSLVFFYNELEDLIEAHETGTTDDITTYVYANVESAETYGTEFETGITVNDAIELQGHLTWLKTENKKTGYDLAKEGCSRSILKLSQVIYLFFRCMQTA